MLSLYVVQAFFECFLDCSSWCFIPGITFVFIFHLLLLLLLLLFVLLCHSFHKVF